MRRAPASSAFSTSSFTTDAGRSITSPAAIWIASSCGRTRMRPPPARVTSACSDDVPRLLSRHPALHLGATALAAGTAGEPIGELLAFVESRLRERLDAEEVGREHRLRFQEIQQLPERERPDARTHDRRARPSGFGERELGRLLLHVDERAEPPAAEIRDAFEI